MEILFEQHSILCRNIRTTKRYWQYIISVKHPESFKKMGSDKAVETVGRTLSDPDIVVKEMIDPSVYLYYKRHRPEYFICVVVKHLNGEGYIITAYITDRIKRGEIVYEKV